MVLLIGGGSHTGKTLLAQRLVERLAFPCLSIDHLKMGLIRSGELPLTPQDDEALTRRLWPILREMSKTAVENRQNLILEGCYIPFRWREGLEGRYLREIRCGFLIFSQDYIRRCFPAILAHARDIENRLDDSDCTPELLIRENAALLEGCRRWDVPYLLLDRQYPPDLAERFLRLVGLDPAGGQDPASQDPH